MGYVEAGTAPFAGQTMLVTGGASGIGESTVRAFWAAGANVLIADINEEQGISLVREFGDRARFVRTNVSQEADVVEAIQEAIDQFGALDCLVNNAGVIGAVGSISRTDAASWNDTIGVLLTGAFFGMKHASRVMMPQRSGVILSVASIAALTGGYGPHAYTAAKHALVGLTKSVASELSQFGIRVNCVAPGGVPTPMTAYALTGDASKVSEVSQEMARRHPLGFAPSADDIANVLLFLATPAARNITAQTIVADGGLIDAREPAVFHDAAPGMVNEASRYIHP